MSIRCCRPTRNICAWDTTTLSAATFTRELFRAHLELERIAEIRNATNGNFALGQERFQAEVARMLKRRVVRATPDGTRTLTRNRGLSPVYSRFTTGFAVPCSRGWHEAALAAGGRSLHR
jgi:hypothetical protein